MNEASWYKLKSGVWGVKIRHDGHEGEQVKVTNKKGESKEMFLVSRAAKFEDAQLWEVSSDQPEEATLNGMNDPEPF